jgi:hypothetical protein
MLRFPLRRALPRAVVLAVAVALVPLPVSAGALSTPQKPTQPPAPVAGIVKPAQPLRAAIEKIDTRDFNPTVTSRSTSRRSTRGSAQTTTAGKESPAFFKSGAGIAVLAVVAVGVGYALYSTSHDRVHSPGKE